MITHAPRRPSDRPGRRCRSGAFGLSAGRSWHQSAKLAGLPMALLLALSALFVGAIAVPATVAGAAISAAAGSSTGTGDPAWSHLGATASRTWASAGLAVNFAGSGDLRVSSGLDQSANWSLAPSGLGRGQIESLDGGADVTGAATRTYDNGQLSVWYSPTSTGVEQGFTLDRRPAGTSGAVTIAMASTGGLTPVLTSPTSLSLFGPSGRAELSYSGLKVTDASDRVLPAHLETSGSSIRIAFNDQGATYPVHVDPFIQLASLIPPTTASEFGTVIATSSNGTTALVGDPAGGAEGTGAATVYTFANGSWSAGTALSGPAPTAAFGSSVALSGVGTTALVGDPNGGTGNTGTATVYTRSGTSWSTGTALTVPVNADEFGTSVALSDDGSTALVGDPGGGEDSTGAATIFTGGGSSWSAGLALAAPVTSKTFGTSVALSSNGSTALVGDPTGGPSTRGIAYSYSSSSWATRTSLAVPSHAATFGSSVALSGSGATALVGDPTGGAAGTGAATVETLTGGVWAESGLLALPGAPAAFGTSVSLDGAGTTALVGDPTGGAGGMGTAGIYTLSGALWSGVTPLSPPVGTLNYGTSVALSYDGSTALVGDPTGGNGSGWVTTYTSNGSDWGVGTGATPPETAFSFGSAVALSTSGSTLLAGDPQGNSNGGGAASIYDYNGTSLSAGTALTPPASPFSFGSSVAVSANGTTVIVGDPGSIPAGAATAYTYNGTTWSLGTPLTPPVTATEFGNSVAISASGTTAIVGDPQGGDSGSGAATIFTFANGSWSAGTSLTAPATAAEFGTSVALSGDGTTALVGDPTGGSGTGAVTAYSYANGAWSGGTPLPTPANASAFGTSLGLPYTGVAAIVGDPTGGSGTGAVNVFSQSGGSWSIGTPLAAPAQSVAFGTSVAMSSSGINAVVGDPQGSPQDQCLPGTGPGTATLYNFAVSSWSAGTVLATPPNSSAFGTSVALSGNGTAAAVGDPCGGSDEDGGATLFSFQSTLSPTTVTASANPTASGPSNSVSYSATVAPQSGTGTPTGTVSFTVGPKTLCTSPLVSGSASCDATDTPVGTGRVYATYSGDSTYASSVGSARVVVTYPSTTSTAVNPTSTSVGSSVTYSATVISGSGNPTGTVSFAAGSTALCTSSGLVSGSASCTATNAPAGNDTITATYSGDLNFSASSGTTILDVGAPTPPPTPPPTPTPTHGYWLVGSDGGIFSFGSAQFYGSTGSLKLQRPVVGIVPTADKGGYWLDASDGGVFAYGDTQYYGSIPGLGLHPAGSGLPNSLNAPIVGMVPSNDDGGYFMVASDGGVFAFGDAHFAGSCPGIGGCSGAAVAVMPDASGNGYWLVTKTGTVYTFGDASYYGAPGNTGSPVTSAVRTPNGGGYWILTADGTVYNYGDAGSYGDAAGAFGGFNPATAIFTTSDGNGYWIASANGTVDQYGDAPNDGDMSGTSLNGSIIAATGF